MDRNEDFLDPEQHRLSTAVLHSADGIIGTGRDGRITHLNPTALALIGRDESEAVGRQIGEVFVAVGEAGDSPFVALERAVSTGLPQPLPPGTILVDGRGRSVPVEGQFVPIAGQPPQSAAMVVVFRDATGRDRMHELNERLAAIVESSDDIIASKTLDGVITSWNRGAERILGFRADEVIGRHISMLMPPEAAEDATAILSRVRRGERVDHYRTKRRRKDGTIIDISLTVSPIRNAQGEIIGASKVGRDVTAELRATELNERLAAIVESSDDIIASKTLDGVITSWNRGAERILGYRADEVIGRHISMLMPPELVEDMPRILGKIRAGERVDHYQTRRVRKDGRIIDVSLTVSQIRDASGRVVGASKIGRDITREKQIEAERIEAENRKDEFLAMLAHELRNPLSAINSATQLFGRLETEQELVWAREVVGRQISHLARLIDDLLDVSRISRGKIALRKQTVDLSPIITSAVEAVRPLLEERKHELSVSLVVGGLQIEADPLRLEQVLVNLLTNAAKYTEAGGRISLTAWKVNGEVAIEVRDTGMGITPELLPHVFELFVQGDRTAARSEGGLGIGLTLVRKLVEMHEGTVTVASEGVGLGSTFTVRLPATLNPPAAVPPSPIELPRVARKSSRVLVVDDNADNARGLSKLLKLLGHDVRTAFDGQEAVKEAMAMRPEVVILDIGLPGMDGYQVVRRLRAEPCCKNALIIAVSGYGRPEDIRRSREAGFDDHLVKPVDYDALLRIFTPAAG